MRSETIHRGVPGLSAALAAIVLSSPAAVRAEAPSFDRKALEEHVRFLASDELRGRGNGTEGLEQAARFISERFETLGLAPAGDEGTYYQSFRVMTGQEIGRRTRISIRIGEGSRGLEVRTDFEPFTFSASGEVEAPLVFAGYGVTAPEHDYDDYASVDVRGKLVLVLRYAPEPFGEHGWHATFVRKAQNAASHGARGLLVVNGPLHHRDDELVPFGADVGSSGIGIPAVHLRRESAEEILAAAGRTLLDLQNGLRENLTPRSFEIDGVTVALTVDVRRTAVEVRNVLGFLPATAGASAAEHLVVGGHYDHLGLGEKGSRDRRAKGSIHNGADDNASGVAGVLELARSFSRAEDRPRGILFVAFAGEELGLRGSYHYTANAAFPLEEAVAMINLDMIGRLRHDRIYLGGIDLLPRLREIVDRELRAEGLTLSGRFTAEEASDHAPFLRAGVPALFFFTGLHGDYHKPTDDPQFINFEGMEKVLRVGYSIADHLLRTAERPVLSARPLSEAEMGANRGAGRRDVYLGVAIDSSFEGEGLRLAYVAVDGPAARAGLAPGDVLLELDGRSIRTSERAVGILQRRRPGDTLRAKVLRDDEIVEVSLRLSRRP